MNCSHTKSCFYNKYIKQHKSDMDNINDNQKKQRPDRRGSHNPMYGRTHSQQSREKMSQAATLRNQEYKKWKDSQHHVSMAEFLSNNPTVEEYIKTLVRESIERFIWKEKKQRLSIPI